MIHLYSAGPLCGGCQALKHWLESNQIAYKEHDISELDPGPTIAELTCSGYPGKAEYLMGAPIVKNGEQMLPWFALVEAADGGFKVKEAAKDLLFCL